MQYSFNLYNSLAPTGALMALNALLAGEKEPPVVLCIGSDLVIGDALGPITGTLIKSKTEGIPCYIYGCLASPVTAKEVKYVNAFLRRTHPGRKVIAIDAAVGEAGISGSSKFPTPRSAPAAARTKNSARSETFPSWA